MTQLTSIVHIGRMNTNIAFNEFYFSNRWLTFYLELLNDLTKLESCPI